MGLAFCEKFMKIMIGVIGVAVRPSLCGAEDLFSLLIFRLGTGSEL